MLITKFNAKKLKKIEFLVLNSIFTLKTQRAKTLIMLLNDPLTEIPVKYCHNIIILSAENKNEMALESFVLASSKQGGGIGAAETKTNSQLAINPTLIR